MFFGATTFSQVPFSSLPSGGPFASGVSATGQVGTLTVNVSYNAIGVSSACSVGNVTWAGQGYTLSGVASQTSNGNLGVFYWSEIPTVGTPNWQNITSD